MKYTFSTPEARRLHLLMISSLISLAPACLADKQFLLYNIHNHRDNHHPRTNAVYQHTSQLQQSEYGEWSSDIRAKLDLSSDSSQNELNFGIARRFYPDSSQEYLLGYYAFGI